MAYTLSQPQLLADLSVAYKAARRHKRRKPYQMLFERDLEYNLLALRDELYARIYKPQPSSCFIISAPKKREIFAAEFRDRIVHHLYFNYVHRMLERTFIADSYSCIKNRGTHFGINRLEQHIRQESQNYREPCFVLKMDIRGYFMHIDRNRLLKILHASLQKMSKHRVNAHYKTCWEDVVDMDFVCYLTECIAMLNPIECCRMKGSLSDWETLPRDKSLFHSPYGCGLPIGNLTSQLFSNVYLNELDQYVKRVLCCKHYGRYVDDFYIVSGDKASLNRLVPIIKDFLSNHLGLTAHEGKLVIANVRQGVEFLGAYLKPHRRYISNVTLNRMMKKILLLRYCNDTTHIVSSQNSFKGVLSHYKTYKIKQLLFVSAAEAQKHRVDQ